MVVSAVLQKANRLCSPQYLLISCSCEGLPRPQKPGPLDLEPRAAKGRTYSYLVVVGHDSVWY